MTTPDLTGLDTHDTTTTPTTPTLGEQQQQTGMTDVQVAAPAEGVAVDQPRLAVAQAPSFCRLCNVELRGAQTWRAHVKSDGHVYKLQLKVAEPGSVVASPPSPSPDTKQEKPARAQRRVEIDEEEEEDDEEKDVDVEDDEDEDEEAPIPDFIPGECLFCMHPSPDLDANLAHMSTAHGFAVPFQDFLAVDLETVVGYLHFVICGYRECISCGARKASVEGARQHMLARGHCRFDVSPDTEEFYEMPSLPDTVEQMQRRQRGDESGAVPVRLPSGKLVAQRRNPDVQEPRAPRRQTTPDRERDSLPQPSRTSAATAASSSSTAAAPSESREVAQRGGASGGNGQLVRSNEAILAAQLSRLRIAGDRAQHKIEARKRRWVDRRNNLTKSKHFRIDAGDSRFGKGFFC
ncbi:prohibitin [Purpureocillium lilacinum]|uniref:Prohibitin n=1 Tax=Purpureocillium lilacinum TaxID=33203 RepID=A0A179HZQ7_PURLI|nr:prohibitin [Purpureocillium lilacinum]OAQ94820.1 prohibitin [Purpureocillium lilacinum]